MQAPYIDEGNPVFSEPVAEEQLRREKTEEVLRKALRNQQATVLEVDYLKNSVVKRLLSGNVVNGDRRSGSLSTLPESLLVAVRGNQYQDGQSVAIQLLETHQPTGPAVRWCRRGE